MKKFLSVLLALAVAFTFTFGSSMSAFAAEYTLDDYNTALTAEKTAQIGYMGSAKTQVVNAYTYDEDGFATIGSVKYNQAAIEAAADAVIADAVTAMDTVINSALNESFPTSDSPAKARENVAKCTIIGEKDATTKVGMRELLEAKTEVLNKTQAPLTKTFVEGKLVFNAADYNANDKAYAVNDKVEVSTGAVLTAVQAMDAVLAEAKAQIKAASEKTAYAEQISGYMNAYAYFKAQTAKVKTLVEEKEEADATAKTVEGAAKAFVSKALANQVDAVFDMTATYPVKATTSITTTYAKVYKEATTTSKATIFGVEIANIDAVTKAEATAVNNAAYNAIIASENILKNSGMSVEDITKLYETDAKIIDTLAKTLAVTAKYQEVVDLGTKLKGTYAGGVKLYDDAKVDEAVKAAEALVNKDLGARDAEAYLKEAAGGSLSKLELVTTEAAKFAKAKADAIAKFYSDVTTKTATVSKPYGDDKTPEADYVYLKETYVDATGWGKVADDAVKAINAATSYAEIEAALAQAKTDLGSVLTKENKEAVEAARASYKTALTNDANTKWNMLSATEKAKYTVSVKDSIGDVFAAVVENGKTAIDKAATVDAVVAAYNEAKAALDAVKTDEEIKAMKEAVEAKANALPYDSKITVADKAAVLEAYNAYVELVKAGGDSATAKTIIASKLNKVYAAEAKALAEETKAMADSLKKVAGNSDADIAATIALKADAEALVEKAKALDEEIGTIHEDGYLTVPGQDQSTPVQLVTAVNAAAETNAAYIARVNFSNIELSNVARLVAKALKEDATDADKKAAVDAYNALNDAQKYEIDASGYGDVLKKFAEDLAPAYDNQDAKADLLDMSRKLTIWRTSKTSIKVTAVGSVKNIKANGYTVKYSFYKKAPGATSYKLVKTTTSNKYTYTNLKKGTNKFQVKVKVYDADGKLVATKMTYYRAAKIK